VPQRSSRSTTHDDVVISSDLATELRTAGLVWHPEPGDRFRLMRPEPDRPDADPDTFVVSEMTIEAHEYPSGTILGFNGTTEWALDSVALEDALWLPREDQLRELLRGTFRALIRTPESFVVHVELGGEDRQYDHPEPEEAYGRALLDLVRLST
jgi:hypothetical protein